jgi:hypothetical protein
LSLPDADGNYFLRPDRIFGAFIIDGSKIGLGGVSEILRSKLDDEKQLDKKSDRRMVKQQQLMNDNITRVERFLVSQEDSASLDDSHQYLYQSSLKKKTQNTQRMGAATT